jgi:hypothetical protein
VSRLAGFHKLLRVLDTQAEAAAQHLNATCRMGCNSCCYQYTMATLIEGQNIATAVLRSPDWAQLLERLAERARAMAVPGGDREAYFRQQVPCALLGDDGLCRVYEQRPAACRFHYVVSPPALCGATNTTEPVQKLDLYALEASVWEAEKQVTSEVVCAPLPLAVLWGCLAAKATGRKRILVRRAVKGLPMPKQWMRALLDHVRRTGGGFDDAVDEGITRAIVNGVEHARRALSA